MKRINRDIHDLFHYEFPTNTASIRAEEMPTNFGQQAEQHYVGSKLCNHNRVFYSLQLTVCPHEGPYRGGHFLFCLNIPESYPFTGVDVWVATSTRPIWHPNIDLATGRVMLPLEWSPVITLTSLALAIQMMLLEPSVENPLNLEACSHYTQSAIQFEQQVQRSLKGCSMGGFNFMPMQHVLCKCCKKQQHLQAGYNQEGYFVNQFQSEAARNGSNMEGDVSHLSEEFDMILDTGSSQGEEKGISVSSSRKRRNTSMQEVGYKQEKEDASNSNYSRGPRHIFLSAQRKRGVEQNDDQDEGNAAKRGRYDVELPHTVGASTTSTNPGAGTKYISPSYERRQNSPR